MGSSGAGNAPWPWTDARNRTRYTDAVARLNLAAPTSAEGSAVTRGAPQPEALWCFVLGGHLGLTDENAAVSVACDMLARPSAGSGMRKGLALLGPLLSRARLGWLFRTVADGQPSPDRPTRMVELDQDSAPPAPAPYLATTLCFCLPPLVAGMDPAPWSRLAAALATPLALMRSWERLLVGAAQPDDEASLLGEPALRAALADAVHRPGLLMSIARFDNTPARWWSFRRQWTEPGIVQRLERAIAPSLAAARRLVPDDGTEVMGRFFDGLHRVLSWLTSYATVFHLGAKPSNTLHFSSSHGEAVETSGPAHALQLADDEAQDALQLAVACLLDSAPWKDAWEIRRRGLGRHTQLLVGSWWARGFVLRALAHAGVDVDRPVRGLFAEAADLGALRWFGAWEGIPADADSLAMALDLDQGQAARSTVERWLEPMRASLLPGGLLPTWFDGRAAGLDHDALEYRGNHCPAVRLALAAALLRHDPQHHFDVAEANLSAVMEAADAHLTAAHLRSVHDAPSDLSWADLYFYPAAHARWLLARACRTYERAASAPPVTRSAPVNPAVRRAAAATRARLTEDTAAGQLGDGGWGSTHRTAFALLTLDPGGLSPSRLRCAASRLASDQRPDGSWLDEPFYVMPGRQDHDEMWHRSRSLTTALCVMALTSYCAMTRKAP